MNKATCIRVMECEIIKEEQSDCSKGFGADGQSDALDISLVKVEWNFNVKFEEQVQSFSLFYSLAPEVSFVSFAKTWKSADKNDNFVLSKSFFEVKNQTNLPKIKISI